MFLFWGGRKEGWDRREVFSEYASLKLDTTVKNKTPPPKKKTQTNKKKAIHGSTSSVPSVTEDTVRRVVTCPWSPSRVGTDQAAVIVGPRGRQAQHLSSLDCVSNMNPGPALLGLRLRARGLSSLVLQSLKLQRRVLNRPSLRGVSQTLTEPL